MALSGLRTAEHRDRAWLKRGAADRTASDQPKEYVSALRAETCLADVRSLPDVFLRQLLAGTQAFAD